MVDLNKGATVELVKALSDDIRTLLNGTKAASAGAAVRDQIKNVTADLHDNFFSDVEAQYQRRKLPKSAFRPGYIGFSNGEYHDTQIRYYSTIDYVPPGSVVINTDTTNVKIFTARWLADGTWDTLRTSDAMDVPFTVSRSFLYKICVVDKTATDEFTSVEADRALELLNKVYILPPSGNLNLRKEVTGDDFINGLQMSSSIAVSTVNGHNEAQITGTGSGTWWYDQEINCAPFEVAVLEFNGKTSEQPSDGHGSSFKVEFYDSSNMRIGTSYNAYILGESRCGYHKYQYVAPMGTAFCRLRMFTRGSTVATVWGVNLKILNSLCERKTNGITFEGHLGSPMIAPKNTMVGFELGAKAGYTCMVTNVNVTKDGVLVALHDDTIDATSNGTGSVRDYTYEQLLNYDFGRWFNAAYTNTKIPKLEDVIQFISTNGMGVVLRAPDAWATSDYQTEVEKAYGYIKKYGQVGKATVKSFSSAVLDYVYTIMGDDVNYILCSGSSYRQLSWAQNFSGKVGLEIDWSNPAVTQAVLDEIIAAGVPISAYIVNDTGVIRRLIKQGYTRFCTDTCGDMVFPMD